MVAERADLRSVRPKKEIILAAGAIDSPKLLLLSGIGPAQNLEALNIPVIHNLPGVGRNLQDRLFLPLVTVQDPGSHNRTSYIDSPSALEQARKEWVKNQSGPLSDYYLPQMIAYLKSNKIVSSKEFEDLDERTRDFLRASTKPIYEIVSVSGTVTFRLYILHHIIRSRPITLKRLDATSYLSQWHQDFHLKADHSHCDILNPPRLHSVLAKP